MRIPQAASSADPPGANGMTPIARIRLYQRVLPGAAECLPWREVYHYSSILHARHSIQTHARRPRLLLRTGDAIGGLIILLAGFLLGLGCGLSASKRQRDERCPRWAYSPLRWPITA